MDLFERGEDSSLGPGALLAGNVAASIQRLDFDRIRE